MKRQVIDLFLYRLEDKLHAVRRSLIVADANIVTVITVAIGLRLQPGTLCLLARVSVLGVVECLCLEAALNLFHNLIVTPVLGGARELPKLGRTRPRSRPSIVSGHNWRRSMHKHPSIALPATRFAPPRLETPARTQKAPTSHEAVWCAQSGGITKASPLDKLKSKLRG